MPRQAGGRGSLGSGGRGAGFPQAPCSQALDVEDVAVVEQTVEDGGSEDLVTGENLWPVSEALVDSDQDAAVAVAVGNEAEKETGLLAAHGLAVHLVDDDQGAVVLAMSQLGGR